MKKLVNLLFVLAIVTTVFSCGKDDDDTTISSENPFVGTWELAELTYTADVTTMAGGQSLTSQTVGNGENMDYTVEFMADAFTGMGDYDIDLVTTVQGTDLGQTSEVRNVEGSGDYTFDETTITFTGGSLVTFEANGMSSSGTSSPEPVPYRFNSDGDLIMETVTSSVSSQQGATVDQKVDYRIRFTKQ